MQHRQKPERRIVSKGEYAQKMGVKGLLATQSVVLFVVAELCLGGAAVVVYLSSALAGFGPPISLCFLLAGLLLIEGAFCFARAIAGVRKATEINAGVPLTLANAANLPTADSLVRASEEPLQAQEAVLLRATVGTQERHSEQLLRAAGERE